MREIFLETGSCDRGESFMILRKCEPRGIVPMGFYQRITCTLNKLISILLNHYQLVDVSDSFEHAVQVPDALFSGSTLGYVLRCADHILNIAATIQFWRLCDR